MADGDGEDQVVGERTGAHTVFLSHASEDSAVALRVCEALEHAGMTCWIAPRDVTPGVFYADEIVHAIDSAKALVLILSQHAAASPHVLREVERATSKRHPLVSLRMDQAPLPGGLEYFLNTSHWLDASEREIPSVMPKLVAAVRRAVEMPTAAVASIAATAAARTSPPSSNTPRRMVIEAGCLTAVAIAGFAAFRFSQPSNRTATPTAATAVPAAVLIPSPIPEKSVAVLPFVDMSEKKDQEYFSDGLSEELIDKLSKIAELRVPARTSSFYFKGKQATIGDIAKALKVAYVLEGSVRKAGNTLRITAQLIKTDAGFHVWSETFDRQLTDVFKVQDEIAEAVVNALKISLLAGALPIGNRTLNLEANDQYMQAVFSINRTSAVDSIRAVELLHRALALDPTFALAWAALSRERAFQAENNIVPKGESESARIEARTAAEKAVALDPSLPEAHLALGRVYLYYDPDTTKASAEFRRALELNPRSGDAMLQLGLVAGQEGRFAERVKLQEQALAMDPLNVNILDVLGNAYLTAGKPSAAEAVFRRQLELSPQNMFVYGNLGIALALLGRPAEALDFMERAARNDAERSWARALLYPALGRKTEADALLLTLERDPSSLSALDIAEVYAHNNDKNRAFEWLDRQYHVDPKLLGGELHTDPLLLSLRGDPRFKALLRKLKLPE